MAACWNVYGSGLPWAPVTSLMAYNEGSVQNLRAATRGRGIWQIPLATAGIAPTTASLNPSVAHLCRPDPPDHRAPRKPSPSRTPAASI